MATVRKFVIVPHSCATMFALVDDVERYPEFLPWCPAAQVFERTPELTRARIEVDFHGLRTAFSTRNAKRAPDSMTLELVEGPFDDFRGEWLFRALGDAGCRVELAIDYAIAAGALQALLAPVFGQIIETLVDRFVQRAEDFAARGGAP